MVPSRFHSAGPHRRQEGHQRLRAAATVVIVAVCWGACVSPVFAQQTLIRGLVHAVQEARGGAPRVSNWFIGHTVIIERLETGEQFPVTTDQRGEFEIRSLPPGRYRLTAEGLRARLWSRKWATLRGYSTEFMLQELRPLTIDVMLEWIIGDASQEPPELSPLTSQAMPLVPFVETCRTGRASGDASAAAAETGEVWGVVHETGGQLHAQDLRVRIEALGGLNPADAVDVQVRTTDTGCFGLAGLWPGRYRVYVDHAPFTFDTEVEVSAAASVRRDFTLDAPPETEHPRVQRLRASRYSRLGLHIDSAAELLSTVQRHAPGLRRAIEAEAVSPEDMAQVSGVVIWRYEPSDWKHHRMPDVSIAFTHEASGRTKTVTTGQDGSYDVYLPQGVYRVAIDHEIKRAIDHAADHAIDRVKFAPLRARLLVLPEGHVVLKGFKGADRRTSGIYPPLAARRSGLMAQVNMGLAYPVDEKSSADTTAQGAANVKPSGEGRFAEVALAGVTFSREEITRPLTTSRSLQSLYASVPGVVVTESVGTLAQITSFGQRRFANRLMVDGVAADLAVKLATPALDEAGSGTLPAQATSGGTQTLVPFAAIEEVTVRTANTTPEFAQTPGAQTAIVTRSGADRRSGELLFETRPRALAAGDYFRTISDAPRRFSSRDGATLLGGPIWPGRLYYLGAAEGQRIDRPYAAMVDVPSVSLRESVPDAVRPILDAFPVPNGAAVNDDFAKYSREFPSSSSLGVFSFRADANLSLRHRLFTRVSTGESRGDSLARLGQQPDFAFRHTESTRTSTATAGLTSAFGATTANDLRLNVTVHRGAQVASTAPEGDAADLDPESLVVFPDSPGPWVRVTMPFLGDSGDVAAGRTNASRQAQFHVVDTFTAVRGRHELRTGVDVTHVEASTPASTRYIYTFQTLPQLRQGRARLTLDKRVPARVLFRSFAGFAQDTFRPSSRLTLNYGVRYSVTPAPKSGTSDKPELADISFLPEVRPRAAGGPLWRTSRGNVAPHVSASYQLDAREGRETTLKLGWDLVFDELSSPGASAFGSGEGYVTRWIVQLPTALPILPETLPAPTSSPVEQYAFPEDLRRPRTYRWHLGIDRSLGRSDQFGIAYVGSAMRDLTYRSAYVGDSGDPVYAFTNEARADYHGLVMEYRRRRVKGIEGTVSYTWSQAIDLDSGEKKLPNLPAKLFDPRENRGVADYDRPHVLRATASWAIPASFRHFRLFGWLSEWQLDLAATYQSGAPFTVELLYDSLYFVRANLIPNVPVWTEDVASPEDIANPIGLRLNPAAFSPIASAGHGTSRRNAFRSPALRQLDAALSRAIRLSERVVAHIRVEAFNVLNTPNFGPVEGRRNLTAFGRPRQSAADAFGTGTLFEGGLVALQQNGGPRSLQIAGRLTW